MPTRHNVEIISCRDGQSGGIICWTPRTVRFLHVTTAAGAIRFRLLDPGVQERKLLAYHPEE